MFRSLHMKLVMIMLLLVTSLMAVVGAFLMTSVTNFYIDDFYEQMSEVFGESNATFVSSLREEAAQEDGAVRLQTMLEAYSGTLSIDSRNRNYYVLDGRSGEVLASSNEDGQLLEQTENILTARNGRGRRPQRPRRKLYGCRHPDLRRRQQFHHLHPRQSHHGLVAEL